jgi:hypothetical protein
MSFEYDNGVMRVENAEGLRWQLTNAEKPRFTFDYDAVSVADGRALRRIGASVLPSPEGGKSSRSRRSRAAAAAVGGPSKQIMDPRAAVGTSSMQGRSWNGEAARHDHHRPKVRRSLRRRRERVLSYGIGLNAFHGRAQIEHTPSEELKK